LYAKDVASWWTIRISPLLYRNHFPDILKSVPNDDDLSSEEDDQSSHEARADNDEEDEDDYEPYDD
jgi:hypothetical protein